MTAKQRSEFSKRLTAAREAKGYTIYRLYKLSGVTQPYLADLERGDKEPSLSTLRKLAEALDTTVGALVD